jgi:hypothetical protein
VDAQLQKSTSTSAPESRVLDSKFLAVQLSSGPARQLVQPVMSQSIRKDSGAFAAPFDSQPTESVKSTARIAQPYSPVEKPHSIGSGIHGMGASDVSNPFGGGDLDLKNQAGALSKPAQATRSQPSATPSDVSKINSEQAFNLEGKSAIGQSAPSNVELQLEPRAQPLNDLPQGGYSSETIKSGSLRGGKSFATVSSSSATSASPIGPLGSAAPADVTSQLEANFRAGDLFHAREPGSQQLGIGSADGSIAPHQTFEALDRSSDGSSANWVHTSSLRAEAGFQDPSLGWIAVRADQSGGGVHATVIPATAEAAHSLGSQMAGLSAHLAESHATVASLSLGTSEGRGTGMAAGQKFNQSAGQERQHEGNTAPQLSPKSGSSASAHSLSHAASTQAALAVPHNSYGKHISVMA